MQGRDLKDIPIRVWENNLPYADAAWNWCTQNLESGSWYAHYGLMRGGPSTYWFQKSEDALVFTLQFGPHAVPM